MAPSPVPSPAAASKAAAPPAVIGAAAVEEVPPPGPSSSAEEPALKDSKDSEPQGPEPKSEGPKQIPPHIIAFRLRFIFGLIWLTTVQYGAIAPSVLYTSTSFFAGPGADCSAAPDSVLCKKGAADLAYWKGWSKGISHSIGWIMALSLGSWSDRHGRRPLFRAKAVFSVLPVVALALHIGLDVSMWAYLVIAPLYDAFDTNGVFLAFMSDVIPEHHSRASAFGVLVVGAITAAVPVLPVAALVPASIAVVIALVAAGIKLGYMFTIFPETSAHALSGAGDAPKLTMTEVVKQAFHLFGRNSFIFRMVLVLVLCGISGAGVGTVATPILTAYLGMEKGEMTLLGVVCGFSVVASMIGLLPRLMASLGPVRSLRLCLGVSAAFPVFFAFCTNVYQVIVLCALLVGPMFLEFPIISAIKSNVVGEDEQGLVQGALAAVRVVAVAVADIFFGWFYRFATDHGEGPKSSTFVPLGAATLLAIAAFVIACTLPNTPPPPPAPQKPSPLTSSSSTKSEADGEGQSVRAQSEELELPRV